MIHQTKNKLPIAKSEKEFFLAQHHRTINLFGTRRGLEKMITRNKTQKGRQLKTKPNKRNSHMTTSPKRSAIERFKAQRPTRGRLLNSTKHLCACLLVLLTVVSGLHAQTTYTASGGTSGAANVAPGSPAGSYAMGNFESVNPYSGKLNFTLPLLSMGGRGNTGYTINLKLQKNWTVDHKVVDMNLYQPNSETYPIQHMYIPRDSAGYGDVDLIVGPGMMKGVMTGSNFNGANTVCGTQPCFDATLTKLTFVQSDGTEIPFRDVLTGGKVATTFDSMNRKLRGRHFVSTDGTNATFISDNDVYDNRIKDPGSNEMFFVSGTLYLANGTKYKIQGGNVTEITDVNGNKATSTKDSLGREITFTLSQNYLEKTIAFKGAGGATRTVKVNYAGLSDRLVAGQSIESAGSLFSVADPDGINPQDGGHNPPVVSNVELPDGRKYEFKYNSYGELAEVKLPTGGRIEYVWQAAQGLYLTTSDPTAGNTYQIYRRVEKRRVYDNNVLQSETRYGAADSQSTSITVENYENQNGNLALINKSKHYYSRSPMPTFYPSYPTDEADPFEGREIKTEVYDASNNLLRKTENTWQAGAPLTGNTTMPINVRLAETIDTLADANLVSKKTFSYDSFNNVTDTYEYDYGTGQPGAFLRRSHTDYVTDSNYLDYTGAHLRGLPTQSWVSSDSAGNNKVSLSQIEYDNYASDANHAALTSRSNVVNHDATNYSTSNTRRGNATASTAYSDAAAQTGAVTVYSQYDILGNVVKTIDAKGNASTISYDDNFGAADAEARTNSAPSELNGQSTFAFPTSATNPLGWTTYAQFDYHTGKAVDAEDINGVVSSVVYNDALDRPTQSISANNLSSFKQQTTIAYDDANRKVTVTSDLNALNDNLLKKESFYDEWGRTTESRKYETGGGYVATKTEYDGLGRVRRVTNPYRPLQNESVLWTTSAYDALGRAVSITTPDNAVVQTAYSGNAVTVTDQAGKARRSITNAAGQLTRVDEPDANGNLGSIASPNQSTSYAYDALNNLTTVNQGVQQRTFQYDSLSRLKQAANPESGTISYSYDANGNLTQKTDARNIVTSYLYDNLNRVTQRGYSDSTPQVNYTYDDANIQFSKGKLTKVASSVSETRYTSFDQVGKVLSSQQITDGNTYSFAYAYNLSGMLLEETYPSGRKVKNTMATDASLLKVESQASGGSYQTRADNFTYTAAGAVSIMQLGNGRWETAAFNSRLQPYQLGLGTSSTDQSIWKVNYAYGTTDNNGNVQGQQITIQGQFQASQNYAYDSLNRLKVANETATVGGPVTWQQTFSYDRYGNRNFDTNNTTTLASCPPAQCNPTVDQSNNRFSSGQGYTYDASGNVTADALGRTFVYDAENKQKSVSGGSGTIGTYSYDGDSKRVKKVSSAETTVFVYDASGQLAAEYLLTTQTPQAPTLSYLTSDHLGSPRVITDSSGNVQSRRDFMPFGEEIVGVGGRTAGMAYQSDSVRQKFTGYERDVESSLDFAEARYYNFHHGRFISVDPILITKERLLDPQALNLYVYVRNNPLAYIDPTGEYFVGTDGKRVEYEVKNGKIVFTSNNVSNDLQRMADLINEGGSEKALSQFTGLANNDTMLHFKIETGKMENGLLGLHQVHDKDGNVLEWDSENGKFKGDPAYIKDKDGNFVYKEATITIYEGNIEESIDSLRNSERVNDPSLTTQEYMLSTFGHEGDHDLNVKAIAAIKRRQDGGDKFDVFKKVEKPAYDVTFKILKEIKKARNKK